MAGVITGRRRSTEGWRTRADQRPTIGVPKSTGMTGGYVDPASKISPRAQKKAERARALEEQRRQSEERERSRKLAKSARRKRARARRKEAV